MWSIAKKRKRWEKIARVFCLIFSQSISHAFFLLHWNQTEVKAPASGPLFMGKKLVVFSWSHTWHALSFPWGLHYLQSQFMKLNSLTFWLTEWTCHSGQGGFAPASIDLKHRLWPCDWPKASKPTDEENGSKGPGFQDSNPDFDIYWLWPWASDMTYLSYMGWC